MSKVYARQMNPEYQHCDIFEEEWSGYNGICIFGNESLMEFDCSERCADALGDNRSIKALYDVIENGDIEERIMRINDGTESWYDNTRECIIDLLPYASELLTDEEIDLICEDIISFSELRRGEKYNSICEIMLILTKNDYDWKRINGCAQGDCNYVFYPKNRFGEDDISRIECEYFNLGTAWDVDEDSENVESADDVNGCYYYAHETDDDKIKLEIAESVGCNAEDVVLFKWDGYIRIPKYVRA